MVLGKLDTHMQMNKTKSLSYTLHKNQLKVENIRFEAKNHLEDYTAGKVINASLGNGFLDTAPKAQATKVKIK